MNTATNERTGIARSGLLDRSVRSRLPAILVCAFFYNAGVSVVMFLHSLLLAEAGWREQAVGEVNSLVLLGSLLAVFPMAWLGARAGLRPVLPGTLALTALACAGRLWLLQPAFQMTLSFAVGVGLSGWIVCISPSLVDAVPEHARAFAFNLLFAVSLAAGAAGGLLGGVLPERLLHLRGVSHSMVFGLRGTLLLGAALLAVAAVCALGLRGNVVEQTRPSASLLAHPPLLRFLLGSSGWNLVLGAFIPFVSLLFARELHVSLPRLSLIFGVVQLTQALLILALSQPLERKFGPVLTIVWLQMGGGVALFLLAGGESVGRAAVFYGVFVIVQRLCEPVLQWVLMDLAPAMQRSASVAVVYFAATLEQALAGSVGGYSLQHIGYARTLHGLGLLAGFSGLMFVLLVRPRSSRADALEQP